MLPKKILHLGDIHIFRDKRFEEHRYRQDQLCNFIIDNKINLVYVGGDIVDSKSRLSPEQIEVTQRFFYKISSIVPMIVIPGNHDLNLKKEKSLDSLTPILDVLDTKYPIYYLKETGIYNIYDIDWCVWSCIDKENPFTKYPDYNSNAIKIGCYHGPVKECSLDSGYASFTTAPSISIFDKCDIAMLADIHKTQFFRNNEIAYCGSLIQTNVSESPEKGGIVWELKNQKYIPTFYPIESDYGFRTFEISDLDSFDVNTIKNIPKNVTVRFLYTGEDVSFSSLKFFEIQKGFKALYNNPVILQKKFKKTTISIFEKTKSTNTKIDFFKKYFNNQPKEVFTQLENLDKKITQLIDTTDYQTGEYFIEEIVIENFLCFGENNIIDLKKRPGVVGILGPNKLGKSSILEAIMFCLFNESPKGEVALSKLVNDQMPAKTEAFVQLIVKTQDKRIRIKRSLLPEGKRYKVKLEVYEIHPNGDESPLHEEDRRVTDSTILRKLIGDKTVFFTTVLYSPKVSTEFVKLRNADRLDAIMRFLGIVVYDQKAEVCRGLLEEANFELQLLKKEFEKLPTSMDLEKRKTEVYELCETTQESIWEISEEIDSLKHMFDIIKSTLVNLEINKTTSSLEELLEAKEILEKDNLTNIASKKEVEKNIQECLTLWDDKEFTILEWVENKEEIITLVSEIARLSNELKHLKESLANEICPTCKQIRVKLDKEKIQQDIDRITVEKKKLEEYKDNLTTINKTKTKLQQQYLALQNKKELIESKQESISVKKKSLEKEIEWFKKNKESIIQKEILEKELSRLQTELTKYTAIKTKREQELNSYYKELEVIENGIKLYKEKYIELQKAEENVNIHTLYKQAMHRTGIPSLILQTFIPSINAELNHYTSQFGISLQFILNDKDLDIVFFYEDTQKKEVCAVRDAVQASGMEDSVINLAIRAALSKINLLPRPSLFIIDEAFSTLDDENTENIKTLLLSLKEYYQNIILITHKEEMKDLPEYHIYLEKVNNITKILN